MLHAEADGTGSAFRASETERRASETERRAGKDGDTKTGTREVKLA